VAFSAAALGLTSVAIIIACLWSWLVLAARAAITWKLMSDQASRGAQRFIRKLGVSPGLPVIAWWPRRAVPWTIIDLVAVFGIYIFVLLLIGLTMRQFGWLPGDWSDLDTLSVVERQRLLIANGIGSILVAFGAAWLVSARGEVSLSDLGIDWRYIWTDLRLGLIGFVMLAPPVYAMQGLLVYLWKPSKHPLMEMFKDAPDAGFFALLFVSAAVVAPLVEEFLFRVLLQGLLEKAANFRRGAAELIFGSGSKGVAGGEPSNAPTGEFAVLQIPIPAVDENPYAPPSNRERSLPAAHDIAEQPEFRGLQAWGPIAAAAAIFALLHYTHGPDWVPLFFLACGMGYLYQRTHRLIPSLTVHVLLNSLSMWGLWVQVHSQDFSS
jgi:membrane protease YdiL (CAAX protease family)